AASTLALPLSRSSSVVRVRSIISWRVTARSIKISASRASVRPVSLARLAISALVVLLISTLSRERRPLRASLIGRPVRLEISAFTRACSSKASFCPLLISFYLTVLHRSSSFFAFLQMCIKLVNPPSGGVYGLRIFAKTGDGDEQANRPQGDKAPEPQGEH